MNKNKLTLIGLALAAAATLGGLMALIYALMPRYSLAALVVQGVVIWGVLFCYTWACEKVDRRVAKFGGALPDQPTRVQHGTDAGQDEPRSSSRPGSIRTSFGPRSASGVIGAI